jgi:eukaryotic-like serine/threonine-protein kinase
VVSSSPLPQHVRVVGRYALYDEIAAGGMATVHIGRLLGPVGFSRTVAIKRLHPQFAKEPDFVSMFLDEARLAARIRHPNVVGTLDVVALEGELFLVMEYVQGESLARLMRTMRDRGEGVPVPIAAAIMVGVLEGLHAAHEATSDQGEPLGIVHRDVSPQNILVGTDGVARVVDFGVAKAAGRLQTTRDGQLKGKLGYMAPEQISGAATRATDIHAATAVLWEMLTARRLFHGENELQTYTNVIAGNVARPSIHAPNVTPALDRLIMRGLAPNPDDRFASARDMARALQATTAIAAPSDVGDWVESIAGQNIVSRARKIAAIESSGMLPDAPSWPEALEGRRSSLPPPPIPSQSPVSGERLRAPRAPRVIFVPIAVAVLAVGALIGVLVRVARLPGPPAATNGSGAPSVLAPPATPPPAPAAAAVDDAVSPAAAARATAAAPTTPPAPQAYRPTKAPGAPQPQPAPAKPPPTAAAIDFTHVMDSRK